MRTALILSLLACASLSLPIWQLSSTLAWRPAAASVRTTWKLARVASKPNSYHSVWQRPRTFLHHCWTECPKKERCAILLSSAFLNLLLLTALIQGCASTEAGLQREQHIYDVSTNAVAHLQAIAHALPAPVATPMETILAIASAGLGIWNVHTHKTLKSLKNTNGAGQNCPQVSGGPPKAVQAGTPVTPA